MVATIVVTFFDRRSGATMLNVFEDVDMVRVSFLLCILGGLLQFLLCHHLLTELRSRPPALAGFISLSPFFFYMFHFKLL